MQLLQKLINKSNGLYYKQDYLCLAKESFQRSLHAYIVSGRRVIKDVTNHHLFAGYSPLVFSVSSCNEIDLSKTENINVIFCNNEFQPNDIINSKYSLARIFLKKIRQQT